MPKGQEHALLPYKQPGLPPAPPPTMPRALVVSAVRGLRTFPDRQGRLVLLTAGLKTGLGTWHVLGKYLHKGLGLCSFSSSLKAETTYPGEDRPARHAHTDRPCSSQGKGVRGLLEMNRPREAELFVL